MNNERFDDLTKALAAPVSRGRMLKMVGGALLGSVLGGSGLALGADEAEAKRKRRRSLPPPPPPPLTCPSEIKCSSVIRSNTDYKIWDGGCGTFYDPNGTWVAACDQDNRDPAFSKLRDYLVNLGFQDYGEPEGFVVEDDQFTTYEEVLIFRLHRQTTGEEALIRYGVDDYDNPSTYAVVSKGEEIPNYVLYVGDRGTVERLQAGFAQASTAVAAANGNSQVGTSDLGDVTFAGFVCDSDLCTSSCQLAAAGLSVVGGAAAVGVAVFIRGAIAATRILAALGKAVEVGLGIGNVSCSYWCKGLAEEAVKEDDEQNCGACGNVCAVAAGEQCCGGQCKNLKSDKNSCGKCGNICPSTMPDCCDGVCDNLQVAYYGNCGKCGHKCPPGYPCVAGKCSCGQGGTLCADNNTCCPSGSFCMRHPRDDSSLMRCCPQGTCEICTVLSDGTAIACAGGTGPGTKCCTAPDGTIGCGCFRGDGSLGCRPGNSGACV